MPMEIMKAMGGRCDFAVLCSSTLAFVLYLNTLGAGFVYDDSRAILTNPDVQPKSSLISLFTNDFWGTPLHHGGSHGSYRPLVVATFRLTASIAGGLNPFLFHLGNVLLHVLATSLTTILARRIIRRDLGTFTAGLVFASHPVHCEAVAGIVGRADVMAAIFFILALLAYDCHTNQAKKLNLADCSRASTPEPNNNVKLKLPEVSYTGEPTAIYLAVCVTFAAAAMLCKESGVMVLPVCWLLDVAQRKLTLRSIARILLKGSDPDLRRSWLIVLLAAISLVSFRFAVAGGVIPVFATADNPASKSKSFLTRLLFFLYLPVLNAKLLVFPQHLSFDWSMDSIPQIESLLDLRNAATLSFYGIFAKFCHIMLLKHSKASHFLPKGRDFALSGCAVISVGILVISFIPASNLIFYVGFVIAERVLYIPSIGYALLIGTGVQKLCCSVRRSKVKKLVALLVIVFSLRTVLRNGDWFDEESLYKAGIPYNPPKSWGNLGNILAEKGQVKEAEFAYKMAVHHRPNMADVYYNLGILLQNQERLEEAIICYKSAIQCRPSLILAHLNLGIVLSRVGNHTEAQEILRIATCTKSDSVRDARIHESARTSALLQIGKINAELGDHAMAVETYHEAIRKMPDHYQPQSLYNLIGESYHKLGQETEAEHWYRLALETKPDHVPAHLTYGKMLARNESRLSEAEAHLRRAQVLAPEDTSVYQHLGQFLAEQGRFRDAATAFRQAIELSPLDGDLQSALGHVLKEARDLPQAEVYFRRAAELKRMDPSSHVNLGAVLHLRGRLIEAKSCYLHALKLNPNHVTAKINLERLDKTMNGRR